MEKTLKDLSRRDFLGGAAVISASVATATLAGCASESQGSELASSGSEEQAVETMPLYTPEMPESWDKEADIVVVGSGIAGACGAIQADDLGMEVLMVTSAAEVVDCACTLSGGAISGCNTAVQAAANEEDNVEDMIATVLRCGGELGDPEVIRAYCENSGETIDWLEELGVPFAANVVAGSGDCFTHNTVHHPEPYGTGIGIMETLGEVVDQRGFEVLWSTPVKKLYRAASGDVVGCYAEDANGQGYNLKARKGVLLATGGFGVNTELWKRYNPQTAWVMENARKVCRSCSPFATGEGILMATAIGAQALRSPANYGGGSVEVGPEPGDGNGNFLPYHWAKDGLIEVTAEGTRYNDETSFKDFFGDSKKFTGITDMWQVAIFDNETLLTEGGQRYAQNVINTAQENGMESVFSANTIEEVCEHFGLPIDAVLASVEEHNSFVGTAGPDSFGRTEFNKKIETPPFWGVELGVSIGLSKGGLAISPKAEVVDVFGDIIPRLFAAGEAAFGRTMGDGRIHISGAQNGSAATFGRLAAMAINELTPQE